MNASLTATERTVLELRRAGMSFQDIADKIDHEPLTRDGRRNINSTYSRQAINAIEKRALAKLGRAESIAATVFAQDRRDYGTIYREKHARVDLGELKHLESELPAASHCRACRQSRHNRLESVVDRLVNDLAEGRASAEWTWHRIAGIHQEMALAS